jgi:hypothetical protein
MTRDIHSMLHFVVKDGEIRLLALQIFFCPYPMLVAKLVNGADDCRTIHHFSLRSLIVRLRWISYVFKGSEECEQNRSVALGGGMVG